MKYQYRLAILFCITLIIAACGRRGADEEGLPTPISTYDLTAVAGSAPAEESAATPEPPVETPTTEAEEVEPPTAEPTASEAITATAEITDTETVTDEATVEPTAEITVTAELTEADEITESAVLTKTEEVTDSATVTAAAELTDTEEITATEPISEEETLTTTESLTETGSITTADALTDTETITATEETTETEETSEAATDERYAGLPENILVALENADVEHGAQLTQQSACIACHNMDPNVTQPGPTWHNLAVTAAERVPDQSAGAYLYNSIIHPNDFVVEGYPPGLMVPTFGDTLSDQELADLIAYLLTLEADES